MPFCTWGSCEGHRRQTRTCGDAHKGSAARQHPCPLNLRQWGTMDVVIRGTTVRAQDVASAHDPAVAQGPRLAEPPIPRGRVEALISVLIRALKSSPLARPLPAVSLSALGLGLLAFTGLCATAPGASEATLPIFCRSPPWRAGWTRRAVRRCHHIRRAGGRCPAHRGKRPAARHAADGPRADQPGCRADVGRPAPPTTP